MNNKFWDNANNMIEDIRNHVASNGKNIVSFDTPRQLIFGYRCSNTGKTWEILISQFRKSNIDACIVDALTSQKSKKDLILEALNT